ncbi:MAG: histidine phosphatase family protein [Lachnospiraceae bacterium]|jgi:probable phosphoglycerate mutase|nr:histidine phosphatase family protein [Lachnospiraceae bacterium]MCI1398442.1 histidine phosphatase family protein [Lachnospiraceae bacterium]MCI1424038.1 histidine phosphatase family protein [Lachnospiraceae bacterium]MCI1452837.1 histidine phosphatase family protein [Lachnospiraceae bacterium]MDD5848586.1 histidine phosphatase family protein [Bacillota bacterium]
MRELYFARHGQTIWNVANKICGSTDIALTELGYQQARQLGEKILAEHLPIDEILYSPLIRASETARIVSEVTGLPRREEVRLKEQNFGRFEGTPRDGAEFALAKTRFADHYGGGESMLQMAQRIYGLVDDLKKEDRTYLLVAHNGIARVLKSYFTDMTNEEYAAFGIRNCEILRFSLD